MTTKSTTECMVCGTQGKASPIIGTDSKPADASSDGMRMVWECPRCGIFEISGPANESLRVEQNSSIRAKISGWIRDQYNSGSVAKVTLDTLNYIASRPLPPVIERATRLLLEAARQQEHLGSDVENIHPSFLAATYSKDETELGFFSDILLKSGLIERPYYGAFKITPDGYARLDELSRKPSESSNGFVAMWFSDELNETYVKGFQKGILAAGFEPIRIDRVEHINRIDDEIIAHIKQSRFVVADFTGHRGGVYFEAGFAMGLDLPVIWTCRKDDMADLHFDIRQFNCIDWSTPEELARRLQNRIEAVLGSGPKKVMEGTP